MMRTLRTIKLILPFLCLLSCAPRVQTNLSRFVNSPVLQGAHTGVVVRSLDPGKDLYSVNATKFFVPASNMKLFTTAVALILLGPDFRYTTSVYTDGTLDNGIVTGNLFIKGVGDPTLSWRFHDGGAGKIFSQWADTLYSLGVRHITGSIVGDGSLFDDQYMGTGWAWNDEIHCYSAQISALSFDDNCVSVSLLPGTSAGEMARVTVHDASGGLTVKNQAMTVPAEEEISIELFMTPGQNILTISGNIPLDEKEKQVHVSLRNPALLAAESFKRVLQAKGIRVDGPARDHKSMMPIAPRFYDSSKSLASYTSPPLSVIIGKINKQSQNLYAELLFRTLGVDFRADGSSQAAAAVIKETITRMGIAPDSVIVYDGSGLSRLNLVTPLAIEELLEYMQRHELFPYFLDSLAEAGKDGTLRQRMRGTPAEASVLAKTGSMTHILNLSGYVKGRDGRLLAFSLMTNNYTGSIDALRSSQDAFCVDLVNLVNQ